MPAAVRKATPDDTPAIARALARAFHDDPVLTWMFPNPRRRLAQSRRFFAMRLRLLLEQEETYTTDDRAGGALWAVPDQWRVPAVQMAKDLVRIGPALGPRLLRSLRGLTLIESRHPSMPHYYLAVLGTDPTRQGTGVGSALLEPVLAMCDEDEIPAYLESSKERNVAFYARHGFRVTEEIELPGGPPVWLMWRDPAP